jgi:HTH-type transcriptional regulator/antitoxin HigA
MKTLKYKVTKSKKLYNEYCRILHDLDFSAKKKTKTIEDEVELLTFLIEKYDEEHSNFEILEPIPLLKSLMKDHKMKAVDVANFFNISKGLVSDMLNYTKGLSKDTIRILSESPKFKDAKMMNSRKKLMTA